MYDSEAIEAINFEQLATVTDRLLVGSHRLKRRPPLARGSSQRLPAPPVVPAKPPVVTAMPPAYEATVIVRRDRRAVTSQPSDLRVAVCSFLIPALLGGLVAVLAHL